MDYLREPSIVDVGAMHKTYSAVYCILYHSSCEFAPSVPCALRGVAEALQTQAVPGARVDGEGAPFPCGRVYAWDGGGGIFGWVMAGASVFSLSLPAKSNHKANKGVEVWHRGLLHTPT